MATIKKCNKREKINIFLFFTKISLFLLLNWILDSSNDQKCGKSCKNDIQILLVSRTNRSLASRRRRNGSNFPVCRTRIVKDITHGGLKEYKENFENKRYKLTENEKDGNKDCDEHYEAANYGFKEKCPYEVNKSYGGATPGPNLFELRKRFRCGALFNDRNGRMSSLVDILPGSLEECERKIYGPRNEFRSVFYKRSIPTKRKVKRRKVEEEEEEDEYFPLRNKISAGLRVGTNSRKETYMSGKKNFPVSEYYKEESSTTSEDEPEEVEKKEEKFDLKYTPRDGLESFSKAHEREEEKQTCDIPEDVSTDRKGPVVEEYEEEKPCISVEEKSEDALKDTDKTDETSCVSDKEHLPPIVEVEEVDEKDTTTPDIKEEEVTPEDELKESDKKVEEVDEKDTTTPHVKEEEITPEDELKESDKKVEEEDKTDETCKISNVADDEVGEETSDAKPMDGYYSVKEHDAEDESWTTTWNSMSSTPDEKGEKSKTKLSHKRISKKKLKRKCKRKKLKSERKDTTTPEEKIDEKEEQTEDIPTYEETTSIVEQTEADIDEQRKTELEETTEKEEERKHKKSKSEAPFQEVITGYVRREPEKSLFNCFYYPKTVDDEALPNITTKSRLFKNWGEKIPDHLPESIFKPDDFNLEDDSANLKPKGGLLPHKPQYRHKKYLKPKIILRTPDIPKHKRKKKLTTKKDKNKTYEAFKGTLWPELLGLDEMLDTKPTPWIPTVEETDKVIIETPEITPTPEISTVEEIDEATDGTPETKSKSKNKAKQECDKKKDKKDKKKDKKDKKKDKKKK
ncbi:knob-associated histidine-rich protein, putative, partial [Plasmodium malariae]